MVAGFSDAPMLAITSNCGDKEQVFEFLKYFWTYEYQINVPNLPIKKDALEYDLKHDPNRDEEEEKLIRDLISRIDGTRLSGYRSDIMDIVQEEAASYFNGDKTLKETEKIMENRVNLYLSEKMG